ncbi:MAG: oligopeptide transporter, OPT family [Euryarchaeota archaeon]|nr:oligopeptide transporter, OPT family [Euryarchaeota archaeon]
MSATSALLVDDEPAELTLRAILVGIVLGVLMTAANAYLGLKVGLTVSASIPAAVISMLVLRSMERLPEFTIGGRRFEFKEVSILENNVVQTMASAGESLAAGVIFTIPALLVMGIWSEIQLLDTFIVAMLGGLLGTMFTISLRRIFIVEEALPYPEGVACREVLAAGEEGGSGLRTILYALGIGAIYGWFVKGFRVAEEKVEHGIGFGNLRFYGGSELSLALMSVGTIVGLRIASFILLGGFIGFVVMVPVIGLAYGYPALGADASVVDQFGYVWKEQVRYAGVGAMVVGGVWTLFSMRRTIFTGLRKALSSSSGDEPGGRLEEDLPGRLVLSICIAIVICTFLFESWRTGSVILGLVGALFLALMSFFFSAVAGYIAGVVGSSNSPVSGMTIATLLFTSALVWVVGGLILDLSRQELMFATLLIASVVAVSAAIAGDVMQDLKTGHLVGATPRRQQIAEILGVVVGAIVIGPVLYLLNEAFRITKTHCEQRNAAELVADPNLASGALADCSRALDAPQAELIGAVIQGVFGGHINLPMVGLGAVIAVLIIVLGLPVMSVAIGLYLPLYLSVPIALGGLIAASLDQLAKQRAEDAGQSIDQALSRIEARRVLVGAGFIAGESIMGVFIALFIFLGAPPSDWLPTEPMGAILSCLFFAWFVGLSIYLCRTGLVRSVHGRVHDFQQMLLATIRSLRQNLVPRGLSKDEDLSAEP